MGYTTYAESSYGDQSSDICTTVSVSQIATTEKTNIGFCSCLSKRSPLLYEAHIPLIWMYMQVCAKFGAQLWRFTHSIRIYPDLTISDHINRVYMPKMPDRVKGVTVTYTCQTVTALLEYVCITFIKVWLPRYQTTFTPVLDDFSKWPLARCFRVLDMPGTDLGSHKLFKRSPLLYEAHIPLIWMYVPSLAHSYEGLPTPLEYSLDTLWLHHSVNLDENPPKMCGFPQEIAPEGYMP
jgi:hypothetical protein